MAEGAVINGMFIQNSYSDCQKVLVPRTVCFIWKLIVVALEVSEQKGEREPPVPVVDIIEKHKDVHLAFSTIWRWSI